MKCLKPLLAAVAAVFSLLPAGAAASDESSRLNGKWVEVRDDGRPRTCLEFSGGRVRFTNLFGTSGDTAYELFPGSNEQPGSFGISISFMTKEKRGNGRIIDRRNVTELRCHTQEVGGRTVPLLSEIVFELDGRGELVFSEYVREEDVALLPVEFASELKKRRNSARPVPSVMKIEAGRK